MGGIAGFIYSSYALVVGGGPAVVNLAIYMFLGLGLIVGIAAAAVAALGWIALSRLQAWARSLVASAVGWAAGSVVGWQFLRGATNEPSPWLFASVIVLVGTASTLLFLLLRNAATKRRAPDIGDSHPDVA